MPTAFEIKLAAKIGRRPEQLSPMVMGLLADTAADGGKLSRAMGSLRKQISAGDFEDYFVKLCIGLQYSYEKFGVDIPAVHLVNEVVDSMGQPVRAGVFFRKEGSDGMLYVQSRAVAEYPAAQRARATASGPSMRDVRLAADENVIMDGVQAGYSAYQLLTPDKSNALGAAQAQMDFANSMQSVVTTDMDMEAARDRQSAYALDALPVKRQALRDLGLGPFRQVSEKAL